MIEKDFVKEEMKFFEVREFIKQEFPEVAYVDIKRTPLGERIIVYTPRPGVIVGKKGENIKRLTDILKNKYKLENPQIEVGEIQNLYLDAQVVADRIASLFERYGITKFKAICHRMVENVMKAGALGVEIRISGKVPSARAKTWRFYAGYLKKSGNMAMEDVKKAEAIAKLKSGTLGIKVKIMPPEVKLPDAITIKGQEAIET